MQHPFSFCPAKEADMEKKRRAIAKTLKESRMFDNKEKVLQRVTCFPDITQDLPISLLKNDLWSVIAVIYKSPRLLSELADAGLETDPRKRDGAGKSAFFHALNTERPDIVFLLYDHVASACLQTDASASRPDPAMVEHLRGLAGFLRELEKELDSEEVSEAARRLFGDLCRFHEFHLEMCKSVRGINAFHGKSKESEAPLRKDTILTILRTYQTYFNSINREIESSFEADDSSGFKEFYEHKDYFDKLDFNSAVMFFDNLFLLKERLKLQNNAYLEIESNFFFFIFLAKYLEQYEKQKRFYIGSVWITFQERLSLRRNLGKFMDILEKTQLTKDNIIDKLPEAVVQTLTNMPQIYGEFLIFRLQHYLNAATEPTLEDRKLVLVVERCLQVMGECFKKSDFNSIQKLLTLSLPSDFIKHLKQIRNIFSHRASHELLYIYNLEQDVDLFKRIKIELGEFKQLLFPIFSFHKYEIDQFLLLHSMKSICKASGKTPFKENENQFKSIGSPPEDKEDEHSIPSFDDMHIYLLEKIIDLNRNGNILDNYSTCKQIVQNLFSSVLKFLNEKELSINGKVVSAVEELESHFWCLEKFLIYITKDRKLADQKYYRKSLILTLRNRKSLFAELKKNGYQFQKINDSHNSNELLNMYKQLGTLIPQKPKKVENSALRKQFDDSIPREATDTKECEEVVNHCQVCKYIQTTIQNEEMDLPPTETISITDHEDKLLSYFYNNNSNNNDAETPEEITDIESKTFGEVATAFIDYYKRMADSLLQELSQDSSQYFNFENIEKYCRKLKRHLDEEEKEFILQSVRDERKHTPDLKENVKDLLRKRTEFNKDIEYYLKQMLMNKNQIREIRKEIEYGSFSGAIRLVESAKDYFMDLKKAIEEAEEIGEKRYKSFCQKLGLSDGAKKTLYKLVRRETEKLHCDRYQFALDRIKMLKNILIKENSTIQLVEESDTTPRIVKEKVVQLYLNDSAFQASIEKLLFDFMAILNMSKQQNLWRKTNNLLNGVNLKCVLAHGHPLLESLGRLLDPCDLPYELVEKIVLLIKDENVIECIQQLKKKGNDTIDFKELLEDEKNKLLSEPIRECGHFHEYV